MSTVEFNNTLTSLESYLMAFAMNYTKNVEDARDLTQETMLKAIRYKDYYTPKTNFKAWVFTIMKNIFINQKEIHRIIISLIKKFKRNLIL
jgi:RNA polymerase sigma factor (sigma-70 family)